MSNTITYNYWCTNRCHTKNIQSNDNNAICDKCNEPMKQLGISTKIVHKGTQEAFSKMNR